MQYEFGFDVVGIIILVLLLGASYVYAKFPTRSKKTFILFSVLTLFSLVFDILSLFMITKHSNSTAINSLFITVKNLCLYSIPAVYYLAVLSIVYDQKKYSKAQLLIANVPTAIALAIIISSPFTHFAFYINETGTLSTGLGVYFCYGLYVLYMLIGLFTLVAKINKINKRKAAFIIVYTLATPLAAIIQLINPDLLAIGLSTTISLLVYFFSLLTPSQLIDSNTGIYNKMAFKEYLITKNLISKHTSLGIVHLNFAYAGKNQYSEESAVHTLKQFINKIGGSGKNKFLFKPFENTLIFIEQSEDTAMDKLNDLLAFQPAPLVIKDENGNAKTIPCPAKSQFFILTDLQVFKFTKNDADNLRAIDKIIDVLQYTIYSNPYSSYVKPIDDLILKRYNERIFLRDYINNAIKNETFEVFMQPVYDLHTDTYTAAESLLRLKGEDGNYILPSEFIPASEHDGNIFALGDISLKKTCEFVEKANFKELGIKRVNINLSTVQCMQDNIVDHLVSIISRYNIPRNIVCFEITEQLIETDPERLLKIMNDFAQQGIEFALDDFGTGFINISTLLKLHFSEVKFDKSLIKAIQEDRKNCIPLKHLMNMLKEASVKVIVQGVETEEMANLIKEYNGDLIQGFFYAKPMPFDKFMQFINENN